MFRSASNIQPGDFDVLHEVLTATDELRRGDTLCPLPLSAKWFGAEFLKRLVYELCCVTVPLALALADPTDPMRTRYTRMGECANCSPNCRGSA
jgi:hypothetical protein